MGFSLFSSNILPFFSKHSWQCFSFFKEEWKISCEFLCWTYESCFWKNKPPTKRCAWMSQNFWTDIQNILVVNKNAVKPFCCFESLFDMSAFQTFASKHCFSVMVDRNEFLWIMLFLVSLLRARICWDMQAEGVQTIKHACQLKDFEFSTQICFEVESLQRLLSWLCISLWFKIVWIIFTSNYDRMLWHLQIMSTKTAFGSFLKRLHALMRKGTRKKNL